MRLGPRALPALLFPLSVFSLSGCAPSESFPDAGNETLSDAHPDCDPNLNNEIDQDVDGIPSERDCDDCDPSIRPLQDGQVFFPERDTTICPGNYRDARIVLVNQDGFTVEGSGVQLEYSQTLEPETTAMELRLSNNIILRGFQLFGSSASILIRGGSGNKLEDIAVQRESCEMGLEIFNSVGNTLKNVQLSGPGPLLAIHTDAGPASGGRNVLENVKLLKVGEPCQVFGLFIYTSANRLQNLELDGAPLLLQGLGGNELFNSTLVRNDGSPYNTGIYIFSSGNTIEGNGASSNEVGLFIGRDAAENTIQDNDFRGNASACMEIHPQAGENVIGANLCDFP